MTTKELKALKKDIEFHRSMADSYKVQYEHHFKLAAQYEFQIRSFLSMK